MVLNVILSLIGTHLFETCDKASSKNDIVSNVFDFADKSRVGVFGHVEGVKGRE
jgi:hypothetical protein